jgi:hypothetical protein
MIRLAGSGDGLKSVNRELEIVGCLCRCNDLTI